MKYSGRQDVAGTEAATDERMVINITAEEGIENIKVAASFIVGVASCNKPSLEPLH